MNKNQLAMEMASRLQCSKMKADKCLTTVLKIVEDELSKGGSVALTGFGTFGVRHRKERLGRNPRTNEAIRIPTSNVPVFRAGSKLKAAVML